MKEKLLLKTLFALPARPSRYDVFAHWAWCLPVMLMVAYLSIRQINWYPPETDEFYSMYNAGWLVGGPFSPLEILESLYKNSANHTPGYFLLLSVWGNLTSFDVGLGRVLGIFFGILSLAMLYRLARKILTPTAGIFAITIFASNAFSNYFYAHVRMYSLLLFLSGVLLWFYFRIIDHGREVRRTDYVALGVTTFLLLGTHIFGLIFGLAIAVYHVLFVPRDRRWRMATISAALAVFLIAPWLYVIVAEGSRLAGAHWSPHADGAWDNIAAWLNLSTNGQPLLLAISLGGLLLAVQNRQFGFWPLMALTCIHLLILGALSDATWFISTRTMRFYLPATLFLILLLSAGLFHLYCYRRWLAILILLWPAAGVSFQANTDWYQHIFGRINAFLNPPWQVIAPLAGDSEPQPELIAYQISSSHIDWNTRIDYTLRQHYLIPRGLNVDFAPDSHQLKLMVQNSAIYTPRFWIIYQRAEASPGKIADVQNMMNSLQYDLCDTMTIGAETTILEYSWNVLECGEVYLSIESESELIEYEFYAARLDDESSTLFFADSWNPRNNLTSDDFMLSYQLISSDWGNVAQLDLPLVHEGAARRFSIDVADVPAGEYHLMVILYDRHTGERVQWRDNPSYVPEMLKLDNVSIR